LRLLIVVEDLCPDSVHTVPYVVALAAQAGVVMRIIDRGSGAAMMKGRRSFNRSKPIQRMPDSSHSGRPGTKRTAGGPRWPKSWLLPKTTYNKRGCGSCGLVHE